MTDSISTDAIVAAIYFGGIVLALTTLSILEWSGKILSVEEDEGVALAVMAWPITLCVMAFALVVIAAHKCFCFCTKSGVRKIKKGGIE